MICSRGEKTVLFRQSHFRGSASEREMGVFFFAARDESQIRRGRGKYVYGNNGGDDGCMDDEY